MTLERYRPIVDDWAAFEAAAARPEPTVFRACTNRVDEPVLLTRLADQGFRTRPVPGMPTFHQVVDEPHPVSMTFEHWNGLLYVQQASTGVAAPALGPRPGERVLDLCAAPGGKTAHIARLMEDEGCLVACEISESRIRGLLGNLYRLGHTHVLAIAGDGREIPDGALFDRVLVDAPCSGEGTLRRRGGRPPHQSRSFAGYVTQTQRALLRRAIALTRPGGTVLYVTCTFAPEENEAVVSDILATEPVDLEPLDLPVPHAPGLTAFAGVRYDARLAGAARIYPHHLDSGGLFLARLRKGDDSPGSLSVPGWSPVPSAFPEAGDAEAGDAEPGGPNDETAARHLIERGLEALGSRYGVSRAVLDRWSWTVRGGRVWMHGADAWPLDAWVPGRWRAISIGLRALEFDTRGRVRPTNDLLRRLSGEIRERICELDTPAFRRLLEGDAVEGEGVVCDMEARGPTALAWEGEIVGRGAVTGEGVKSEIPKARAADMLRALDTGRATRSG